MDTIKFLNKAIKKREKQLRKINKSQDKIDIWMQNTIAQNQIMINELYATRK